MWRSPRTRRPRWSGRSKAVEYPEESFEIAVSNRQGNIRKKLVFARDPVEVMRSDSIIYYYHLLCNNLVLFTDRITPEDLEVTRTSPVDFEEWQTRAQDSSRNPRLYP